jgi:hypothetical protein
MHAEDREKAIAMMAAILLAPKFDGLQLEQKDDSELLHESMVEIAIRTARVICDVVEDQEQRHEAVVFEAPDEREQPNNTVAEAARRLGQMGQGRQKEKRSGEK